MGNVAKETLYELQEHLESLLNTQSGKTPEARWREALKLAAVHISSEFQVTDNEVAVLIKTRDGSGLKFVFPPNLAAGANVFPLKVWSFAGNVVRTKMGALDNAFMEKRHLSIYEHIKMDGPKTGPIHKIMAAPLKSENGVFGVVEVSRKGKDSAEAGLDFTTNDLANLHDILDRVAPYLETLIPSVR